MGRRDDGEGLLVLGRRRSGGAGEGWRRWCWKESQLIGASGGGGRLRWRREEPERTSSGGAGGAAAAGTCAARGPVPCGPARLSRRPEPAQSHRALRSRHRAMASHCKAAAVGGGQAETGCCAVGCLEARRAALGQRGRRGVAAARRHPAPGSRRFTTPADVDSGGRSGGPGPDPGTGIGDDSADSLKRTCVVPSAKPPGSLAPLPPSHSRHRMLRTRVARSRARSRPERPRLLPTRTAARA